MILLAPCGIPCAVCYAHLRKKRPCPGCRGPEESQPAYCGRCKLRSCAFRRGLDFCYECASFPCMHVKKIDARYRRRYEVSLIENSIQIKTLGAEQFLREEEQRWTCPPCGGVICLHNRTCSKCGKARERSA